MYSTIRVVQRCVWRTIVTAFTVSVQDGLGTSLSTQNLLVLVKVAVHLEPIHGACGAPKSPYSCALLQSFNMDQQSSLSLNRLPYLGLVLCLNSMA